MADEPLWEISFCEPGEEKWVGGISHRHTRSRRGTAIPAGFLGFGGERAPHRAQVRFLQGVESVLLAMLVAVSIQHGEPPLMLRQIRDAMKAVARGEKGRSLFWPLRLEFSVTLEVDDLNLGRPRPIKMITWGDRDDWPEWNRCTVPASS